MTLSYVILQLIICVFSAKRSSGIMLVELKILLYAKVIVEANLGIQEKNLEFAHDGKEHEDLSPLPPFWIAGVTGTQVQSLRQVGDI